MENLCYRTEAYGIRVMSVMCGNERNIAGRQGKNFRQDERRRFCFFPFRRQVLIAAFIVVVIYFVQLFVQITFTAAVHRWLVPVLTKHRSHILFVPFVPGYNAQLYHALVGNAQEQYDGGESAHNRHKGRMRSIQVLKNDKENFLCSVKPPGYQLLSADCRVNSSR